MELDQPKHERQAVLDQSPLLRAVLDPSFAYEPSALPKVIDEAKKVLEEINEKFGENFFHLGIYPIWTLATFKHIFSDAITSKDQVGAMDLIASVGYQIGDLQNASLFVDDVMFRLIEVNNFKLPKNMEDIKETRDIVWTLLSSGVYWKKVASGETKRLDPFVKYINDKPDKFDLK